MRTGLRTDFRQESRANGRQRSLCPHPDRRRRRKRLRGAGRNCRDRGFSSATAGNLREARLQIGWRMPDAVLADLRLPDGSGVELFEEVGSSGVEVILTTGYASVESAVEALRLGATDYLVKPINVTRLQTVLKRIATTGELKAEIHSLRGELRRYGRFGRLLGSSEAMQAVYDQLSKVGPTEATVLLIGESGTGRSWRRKPCTSCPRAGASHSWP